MSLGVRLTKLRLKSGESLQEVADAVGVSKALIWELEKGRADNPSLTLVIRLADHFKTSLAVLIGEDPKASDADPTLARLFRLARGLHPDDLKLLDDVMASMLSRRGQRPAAKRRAADG